MDLLLVGNIFCQHIFINHSIIIIQVIQDVLQFIINVVDNHSGSVVELVSGNTLKKLCGSGVGV